MRQPPSYVPLVTRTVALIDVVPVELQVAPVIAPPPPPPPPPLPTGVADAVLEFVADPFTVFLIQK